MTSYPPYALPVGKNIGGYNIIRVIGQGGFGIVYEAVNPVTDEHVAIKEFYPSAIVTRREGTIVLNNERERDILKRVLDRFEDTSAVLKTFDHPNILVVLNYIQESDTGYMISKFIDGAPLRNVLDKHGGCFPSDEMFHTQMEQVLGAIGYVHRQGHIHRDISPDNVMIDQFDKPIVIDFGALKRDLRKTNAYSTIVMLRDDYAPPEQYETGLGQNYYTDIFALAGTMYCTLAGAPPKRATARLSVSPDSYVPIAQASKIKCPDEVFKAIDCALKLPVKDRPQTIEEFASMLRWRPNYGNATAPTQARTIFDEDDTIIVDRGGGARPGGGGGRDGGSGRASGGGPARPETVVPRAPPEEERKRRPIFAYAAIAVLMILVAGGLWASAPRDVPQPRLPPPVVAQPPETTEKDLAGSAISCVRSSSSNYDSCERIYTSRFPYGPWLAEIRKEIAAKTPPPPVVVPQPPPPPLDVLPNGTYSAVRGYYSPSGSECRGQYGINGVRVFNGSISFESDEFAWEGTVNQKTGYINIPNLGIRNTRTGALSKNGLSVSGDYRNADLNSGLCGRGFFRLSR